MVVGHTVHGHAGTHVGGLDLSLRLFHGCLLTRNLSVSRPMASLDVVLSDWCDGRVGVVGGAQRSGSPVGSRFVSEQGRSHLVGGNGIASHLFTDSQDRVLRVAQLFGGMFREPHGVASVRKKVWRIGDNTMD